MHLDVSPDRCLILPHAQCLTIPQLHMTTYCLSYSHVKLTTHCCRDNNGMQEITRAQLFFFPSMNHRIPHLIVVLYCYIIALSHEMITLRLRHLLETIFILVFS